MRDDLGNRIKENYENRFRYFLPRRGYTLLRLDGKAFHSYCKKLKKPFDLDFMSSMDKTAQRLCEKIQGAQFAFVQSDEISILITDFSQLNTDAWYDGNIQKICSVSAAMASVFFMQERQAQGDSREAFFDSRVFFLADPNEVFNVFLWRQQDATRNSIQSVAQSLYSHKELMGKNTSELQELIFRKGINWNNLPAGQKRGRFIYRSTYEKEVTPPGKPSEKCIRHAWVSEEPPVFTQDVNYLKNRIPLLSNICP